MPGNLELDHIAIGARSLKEGCAYIQDLLGVELPPGGRHPLMGTHNHLSKMAGPSFLELISIDPDATTPDRPRWFGLDDNAQQYSLAGSPRPIAWIAGTNDIDAALFRARQVGLDLGRATRITRGDLSWLISIRDDGALPEYGTLPVLIQWPEVPHPALAMADLGIRLARLTLCHPEPDKLRDWLVALGVDHLVEIEKSHSERAGIQCQFIRPGDHQTVRCGP